MIAQVWRPSPRDMPEQQEQARKLAEDAAAKQRAIDGCEAIYILRAPGGVFLALTLWRDEAAMKAGAGQQAGNIAAAQQQIDSSIHVGEPEVYEVVASA